MLERKEDGAYTRTRRTEEKYRRMAMFIIAKFERELGTLFEEEPLKIIEEIAQSLKTKKKKTILNYRNALYWYLKEELHHHLADYVKEKLWSIRSEYDEKRDGIHTSAMRARVVPKEWLDELLHLCRRSLRSQKAMLAYAIIRGGTLLGLRPSEWQSAQKVQNGRQVCLVVQNGKFTNGRSFGPTRTLILQTKYWSKSDMEMIDWLLEEAHKYSQEEWEIKLNKVSDYLNRLRKAHPQLASPRVTIYSGRHQFAANAKKAGFSLQEIAALMGHRNIQTAIRHYGLRKHGDEEVAQRFPVRPSPNDVDQVYLLQRKEEVVQQNIPSWMKEEK